MSLLHPQPVVKVPEDVREFFDDLFNGSIAMDPKGGDGFLFVDSMGYIIPFTIVEEFISRLWRAYENTTPEEVAFYNFQRRKEIEDYFEERAAKIPPTTVKVEPLPKPEPEPGYVYVVSNGTLHKIGASSDPQSRINNLRNSSGSVLRTMIVARGHGHFAKEHELHRMFHNRRIVGEWFHLDAFQFMEIYGILESWGDIQDGIEDW